MDPEEVTTPSLDATGIKRVQAIVGAVILYDQSVDKKLLVSLNDTCTQQAKSI